MTTIYKIHKVQNAVQIRCTDCDSWVHATDGGRIRHSKRCDYAQDDMDHTPVSDSAEAALEHGAPVGGEAVVANADVGATELETRKAVRLAREGSLGQDYTYDLYKAGRISMSDAMNQDF